MMKESQSTDSDENVIFSTTEPFPNGSMIMADGHNPQSENIELLSTNNIKNPFIPKHLYINKVFEIENPVKTRTRQREAVTTRYQKLKESTAIQDEQSEIPSHDHRYRCGIFKVLVRMITLVSIFGMIFVTIKHNSSFGHSTDASSTAVYKHDILITSPYYLNTGISAF
ncbi:unnamed protein product [Adineta steineri]|uniref:Uncharacterized protein n=1 Tax=Adineta steineri TaxID=433720 RepID=A0A819PE73_9BILA|nr:unnamed protein product [Adineta steineri]CAF4011412.1 unnamed protein product [Adineta steineri]